MLSITSIYQRNFTNLPNTLVKKNTIKITVKYLKSKYPKKKMANTCQKLYLFKINLISASKNINKLTSSDILIRKT